MRVLRERGYEWDPARWNLIDVTCARRKQGSAGALTLIGPLEIRNPVIKASFLNGDTPENLRAAYEAGAGAVVTKSVTLEPRNGNPDPNLIEVEGGGWLNCIGLRNAGAAEFARVLGKPDYPVIVSLAGTDPASFTSMIGMFECATAFELNLSCPNVDGFGDYVGHDPAPSRDRWYRQQSPPLALPYS